MTRLIDADALIKTLNEKNIPVDVRVNYEIMNAPTIEPDGDLISRQDVIELVKKSYYDLSDGEEDMWAMVHDVESLPSAPSAEAEQVTGKLKNPDDSLLTADSEACKEQKSKLDLIRRQDAIDAIARDIPFITFTEDPKRTAQRIIGTVSSAETPTASEKHQLLEETSTNTSTDLISRQDATDAFGLSEKTRKYGGDHSGYNTMMLYEIQDVLESLPSAPDSRQRGGWVRLEREENVYDLHGVPTWGVNYMCDKCGFITTAIQDHFGQYRWCPSCGARMYKGGDNE